MVFSYFSPNAPQNVQTEAKELEKKKQEDYFHDNMTPQMEYEP